MSNKKKRSSGRIRRIILWILCGIFVIVAGVVLLLNIQIKRERKLLARERETMMSLYGENRKTDSASCDMSMAVTCSNGIFVGQEKDQVISYKGIPYAKAPVGELRWKRPVPADEDDGIYEAYYYGKSAIQTEAETERASFYPQGEDCLTLNIWTGGADALSSGKPVMVFFPGGGYGWGGTADPIYDGQNFVRAHQDIVLVTVNYRIGLMGFIDFSEVEGGEDFAESGNLGLLDQICALEWVRRNIAGFGGDPDQVTIFGESAGGSSVSLLPLIKEAKGLFRRVIAQSGSVAFTYSREEGKTLAQRLLKKTGARSMDELMSLSEEELMKLNESLNDYNNFPERDGIILPEDPYEAYSRGEAADVDLLIGSNADEVRYWIGEVGGYRIFRLAAQLLYKSTVVKIDPKDRHYVDDFMQLQTGPKLWKRAKFMNELVFRIPAVVQAAAHADSGGSTYMSYWTKESAIPHYGACHAVELSYVFNNTDDTIFTGEKADPALAAAVQEMWVNFAKTGNPSTAGHAWEAYNSETRNTMFLGDGIHQVSDPMKEARELIEPLLVYRINGYYEIFDDAVLYMKKEILKAMNFLLIILVVIIVDVLGIKWIRRRRRG